MGGLHICFNFLRDIAQHMESAGLDYLWTEAGVHADISEPMLLGDTNWPMRLCGISDGLCLNHGCWKKEEKRCGSWKASPACGYVFQKRFDNHRAEVCDAVGYLSLFSLEDDEE